MTFMSMPELIKIYIFLNILFVSMSFSDLYQTGLMFIDLEVWFLNPKCLFDL